MIRFLKDNWLWIVAPIVLLLVAIFVLIKNTSGEDVSPFVYTL